MRSPCILDKIPDFHERIRRAYLSERRTIWDIGKELGCSGVTVYNHLKRLGIELRPTAEYTRGTHRPPEVKAKLSRALKGRRYKPETIKRFSEAAKRRMPHGPNWKGGRRMRVDGYKAVRVPGHPYATQEGYVMEHRLVMERHLGRYLEPEEVVHHINHDKTDNRIENLQLFSSVGEHTRHHLVNERWRRNA